MERPKIVAVLGMHRSGTSAITRGLRALSVDLGANLAPAIAGENDKGFWEDRDISLINRRVLEKLGSDWDRTSLEALAPLLGPQFSDERYAAASLLEEKLGSTGLFGFKDPRSALILPFWTTVFEDLGIEDTYLITLRNPLEVAESLRKRNGLDTAQGLLLWLKYTWQAVAMTTGKTRCCVAYQHILSRPAEELARISRALDLPMPAPSSADLLEYSADFLARDLRHNRISDREVARSSFASPELSEFYSLLLDWSRIEPGSELNIPAQLRSGIETYFGQLQLILELNDRLHLRNKSAEVRIGQLDRAQTRLTTSTEELRTAISEKNSTISRISQEIEAHRQSEKKLAGQIESLNQEMTGLRSQLAQFEANLQAAGKSLEDRDQLISSLRADLAKAAEKLEERNNKISALQTDLQAAGKSLEDRDRLRADLEQTSARLRKSEAACGELKAELDDGAARSVEQLRRIAALEQEIAKSEMLFRRQMEESEARGRAASDRMQKSESDLRLRLGAAESRLKELSDTLDQQVRSTLAKELELTEKIKETRLLRQDLNALKTSTSWRVTRPMRIMKTAAMNPQLVLKRLMGK